MPVTQHELNYRERWRINFHLGSVNILPDYQWNISKYWEKKIAYLLKYRRA